MSILIFEFFPSLTGDKNAPWVDGLETKSKAINSKSGCTSKVSSPSLITSFTDPSVGFGLQFKIEDNLKDNNLSKTDNLDLNKPMISNSENTDDKSGEVVSLDEFRDKK